MENLDCGYRLVETFVNNNVEDKNAAKFCS